MSKMIDSLRGVLCAVGLKSSREDVSWMVRVLGVEDGFLCGDVFDRGFGGSDQMWLNLDAIKTINPLTAADGFNPPSDVPYIQPSAGPPAGALAAISRGEDVLLRSSVDYGRGDNPGHFLGSMEAIDVKARMFLINCADTSNSARRHPTWIPMANIQSFKKADEAIIKKWNSTCEAHIVCETNGTVN